jgi:hypothetical protein
MRELVLAYERPTRFSYELLSGLPLRDHIGEVTLRGTSGGTEMSYRIETTPTVPVGGFAVIGALRVAIGRLMAGVAADAERRG